LNNEGDEIIMNEDVTRGGYEYVLKDEIGSNNEEKDDSDDSEMNEEEFFLMLERYFIFSENCWENKVPEYFLKNRSL
jgi:hypothetical protein